MFVLHFVWRLCLPFGCFRQFRPSEQFEVRPDVSRVPLNGVSINIVINPQFKTSRHFLAYRRVIWSRSAIDSHRLEDFLIQQIGAELMHEFENRSPCPGICPEVFAVFGIRICAVNIHP